jgi:hypothetical protein
LLKAEQVVIDGRDYNLYPDRKSRSFIGGVTTMIEAWMAWLEATVLAVTLRGSVWVLCFFDRKRNFSA